jgi:Flp pilus assembly protein TadG
VEFAVLAPLLALLTLGLCETGRAIMVKAALTEAARLGCRTAIRPAAANAAILSDVNKVLTDNNISTTAATVTILLNGQAVDAHTATMNDQISVRVSIPYGQVSWTASFWFIASQVLESETIVMLRQG